MLLPFFGFLPYFLPFIFSLFSFFWFLSNFGYFFSSNFIVPTQIFLQKRQFRANKVQKWMNSITNGELWIIKWLIHFLIAAPKREIVKIIINREKFQNGLVWRIWKGWSTTKEWRNGFWLVECPHAQIFLNDAIPIWTL